MFVYILYGSVNHFLCPRDLVWRWLGLHSWRPELAGIIPYRVVIRFPEKDGDKHPLPDFVSQRTVQDKVGKTLGTVSDSLKKKTHQAVRHYLGVKWRQPYCFHYIYYILGLLTNSTLYMTSYSTVCNSLIFLCHLFPMLICLIQKIHQLHILYSNICCCGAICLGTRRTYLNLRPGTKFSTKLHYNRLI